MLLFYPQTDKIHTIYDGKAKTFSKGITRQQSQILHQALPHQLSTQAIAAAFVRSSEIPNSEITPLDSSIPTNIIEGLNQSREERDSVQEEKKVDLDR
jgi:hypothetical protein